MVERQALQKKGGHKKALQSFKIDHWDFLRCSDAAYYSDCSGYGKCSAIPQRTGSRNYNYNCSSGPDQEENEVSIDIQKEGNYG